MCAPDDLLISVSAADHVQSAQGALFSIIELGDFECPNCKQAAAAVLLFIKRFQDRLTLLFRHFPLEEVPANALTAVEANEAAGGSREFCICELDGYFEAGTVWLRMAGSVQRYRADRWKRPAPHWNYGQSASAER